MASGLAVIGSGYVGTVVAACLAHIGHRVTAVESDPQRLGALRSGVAPVHEPGLDELLCEGLRAGNLRITDDFALAMHESDIVFICVGTPPGVDGQPDMTAMKEVAREIGAHLSSHHVIVTKSTVPVGTSRWVRTVIEDSVAPPGRADDLIDVVSNPEFLREGSAVLDFLLPDRVVIGGDSPAALDAVADVYRPIIEQRVPRFPSRRPSVPLVRTNSVTAEMVKYASNSFLATKISFANQMARICHSIGADVTEVTNAMGLDQRIGPQFLSAGIGWGGSCFGKDLAALLRAAKDYGYQASILEATIAVNEDQRSFVVEQLLAHLKTLRGARVGLLGLAFKPGTDDTRDSPAIGVAARLIDAGAVVSAYDPLVREVEWPDGLRIQDSALAACTGADAVVLATDWPHFTSMDLAEIRAVCRGDVLFDGRNALDPAKVEASGFRYLAVGRASAGMRSGTGI
ncbi:MAG TPA: UDP-glucose/GDP-mannose dehydrogenase family protein [Acidimicrobiales bacterium]|nr:UDP-glucose/GDP-mannose dehydrogenase family protein [Acidimicrobiales bacterium]